VHKSASFVLLLLATACDNSNTSSVSADYETLRVKQLALTDASGKTVVMVTAERSQSGSAVVVLKDATGSVFKTIEVGAR
jgi:hypothetical protein